MDKEKENLVAIYMTEDSVESAMIESALKDAEIEYVMHNHEVMDYLQTMELNSKSQILVLDEDVERAQEIIAEVQKTAKSDGTEESGV